MFAALVAFAVWFSQRDHAPVPPQHDDDADDLELTPEREPPTTVFEAADVGDVDALRAMLDERPERIGLRDESGWTPLHHACYRDHVEVVVLLLERGADANAVAVGECVPIHMAATEGSAATIDALAAGGADLNIPDDTGVTALHYAALPGRLDVVEALIRHGAAVNMKDAKQETALDVAQRLDDVEVAQAIEKAGGKNGTEVHMKDVLAALPDGPARTQVPRAWHLDMESAELQGAVARAKETLPRFLAHLAENEGARSAVKFGVRGEGIVEYVWGEVVELGAPLKVTVTTPPVAVPSPPDPCEVAHDEIVDWQLKLDEDRTAGGYSQRATYEAIRAEYGFLPADIEEELAHLVDL
ncbi:MAG: ankyrin repeat domain-containing protein [Myxococcota bacterium]